MEIFDVKIAENQKIHLPDTQQHWLPYYMPTFLRNRMNPGNYSCAFHKYIFMGGNGYFSHLEEPNFRYRCPVHTGLICHAHENPIKNSKTPRFYKHLLRDHFKLRNLAIAKINKICKIITILSSEVKLEFNQIEMILRKCDYLLGVFDKIGLKQNDRWKSDIQEIYLFYMACFEIKSEEESLPKRLTSFDGIDSLLSEYLPNIYSKYEFHSIIRRFQKCKQKSMNKSSTTISNKIKRNLGKIKTITNQISLLFEQSSSIADRPS